VYVGIILVAAVFNSVLALFCSTLFRKTSVALMMSYLALLTIYVLPLAIYYLTWSFAANPNSAEPMKWFGIGSPLMAIGETPFTETFTEEGRQRAYLGNWGLVFGYFGTTAGSIGLLFIGMIVLFKDRWRLTGHG
jgi:hypothetical protein